MQDLIIKSSTLTVTLTDYGARLLSVEFLQNKEPISLLLGYDNTADYLEDPFYMGTVVGPIANRIRNGAFRVGDTNWQLPLNEGEHSLHSSDWGYDRLPWSISKQTTDSVTFDLQAPHRGKPIIEARYQVKGAALSLDLIATCETPSYFNMTSHAYWNLSGTTKPIDDHSFEILAQSIAMVDDNNLPTGEEKELTPPKTFRFGDANPASHAETHKPCDHHFTVDESSTALKPLVNITSEISGVTMQVRSTKPGFQLYCGQYLAAPFTPLQGFCVEPQYLPDAINLPARLAPIVDASRHYYHRMEFEFF
jgi:aldose 1-epimerase